MQRLAPKLLAVEFFAVVSLWLISLSAIHSYELQSEDERIRLGELADKHIKNLAFPFYVQLKTENWITMGTWRCGGSIIAPEWILTAAHCLDRFEAGDVHVFVGHYEFSEIFNLDADHKRDVDTEHYYVHPGWDATKWPPLDDIAMIKVDPPFDFGKDDIKMIEMETKNVERTSDMRCKAIGFGMTETQQASLKLLWTNMTITGCPDYPLCKENFVFSKSPKYGSGICKGDSGGPLMCIDEKGSRKLVGLTSHMLRSGIDPEGCHPRWLPALFTSVDHYQDWIELVMDGHVPPSSQLEGRVQRPSFFRRHWQDLVTGVGVGVGIVAVIGVVMLVHKSRNKKSDQFHVDGYDY